MKKVTVFSAVVLALLVASPAFARGGRGGCRGGGGGGRVYVSHCAPTQIVTCAPVVVSKPVVVSTCTTASCGPVVSSCAPASTCGKVYVSSGRGKGRCGGGRCR